MRCAARSRSSRRWTSATPVSPADRRIEFRIGINLGDVIVEGDDIFGDGVNIAARLEASGRARRHLRLGRTVHDQVRTRLDSSSRTWASSRSRTSPARCVSFGCAIGSAAAEAPAAPEPRAAAPRQAVDRGPAVPEHERRPGAGVFRRRHGRGDHHRVVAHPLAVRHRAQFDLHLQGPSRRCESRSGANWACAMCSKARCARAATGCASPGS